jgi:hypothetical protein
MIYIIHLSILSIILHYEPVFCLLSCLKIMNVPIVSLRVAELVLVIVT